MTTTQQAESMSDKENDDNLVVIGAGLSRSGTMSMRAALEQLLKGPCYHGVIPVIEKKNILPKWEEAITGGKLSKENSDELLGGYKAGVDYPFNLFWKDLLELHPTAKVVLTVRDHASHYKSLANLMGPNGYYNDENTWPMSWFNRMLGTPWNFLRMEETWESPNTGKNLFQAIHTGEAEGIQFLKDWEDYVKSGVPADKLLVFSVKEGWDPLCSFLGLPKPETPFPNVNDSRAIDTISMVVRACAYVCVLGVPAMLAVFLTSLSSSPTHLAGMVVGACFLALCIRNYADNYLKTYAKNARTGKK